MRRFPESSIYLALLYLLPQWLTSRKNQLVHRKKLTKKRFFTLLIKNKKSRGGKLAEKHAPCYIDFQ